MIIILFNLQTTTINTVIIKISEQEPRKDQRLLVKSTHNLDTTCRQVAVIAHPSIIKHNMYYPALLSANNFEKHNIIH